MTISLEWRVKFVNSPRESKKLFVCFPAKNRHISFVTNCSIVSKLTQFRNYNTCSTYTMPQQTHLLNLHNSIKFIYSINSTLKYMTIGNYPAFLTYTLPQLAQAHPNHIYNISISKKKHIPQLTHFLN